MLCLGGMALLGVRRRQNRDLQFLKAQRCQKRFPLIRMKNSLLRAACTILLALLHPQPAGALTVDTGGAADVGTYASMAIVAGRPAIAYQDETNSDVRFVRASDASGTAWQAPVTVDSADFVGIWATLAIVNGNPAICYYDASFQRIKYVRATDAEGTAWGAPVVVTASSGSNYSITVVDGMPAIAYGNGANEDLYYVRATNANGSAWGSPVLVDGMGNFDHPSLRIVNGRPAIAYSGTAGLWYVRASDAIGSAWGARVNVDGSVFVDYGCSLEVVNGNPAIAYHDATNGDLRYVRAVDVTGSAWGTRITVDSAGIAGWFPSMAIVGGNPAISYYVLGPEFDLKYVRAADVNGATWNSPVTVDSVGDVGLDSSLLEVNGNAAIGFHDLTDGDLKYLRATDASGGTLWPADIAVEQPVNTSIPDGGSKSFGVVEVGSTTDLIFTLKNPNSGSENLTGLVLAIDGPDAAEFSVIAHPAAPVPGGANSNFTVRYAPVSQGMKTAALHIASSAEGSRNPYDITLTGASVPDIAVEQPAGAPLADGQIRTFPSLAAGSSADLTFTVKNPGGFDLTGLGISIDGPNADEFSVLTGPVAPVPPGSSTTFTVRYTAASPGAKTAALHLASNVSGSRNPFDILLTAIPGKVDPTFNPGIGNLSSLAVQPDGKILAGGLGVALARFLPDGTREVAFAPNVNSPVVAIAVQADGKIVIGGGFNTVGGVQRSRIARLNPDGSLDPTINLNPNGDVSCLAIQADGKILLGGFFTNFGAVGTRNFIARLNADGSLDGSFNPDANGPLRSIAVQADGKILVGGIFSSIGGMQRNRIGRLNSDGSIDAGWNPGAGGEIRTLSVQADGKIIAGGAFQFVGNFFPANRIARFNADGSVDFGFGSNVNGTVHNTVLQADGKILMAGDFTAIDGVTRNRIARLNANGTLDAAFNPSLNFVVLGIAIQADGKILQAGSTFSRLLNDPAPQALTASGGNQVVWLRAGSAAEIEQVSFELSTDGGNSYSPLGAATRIAGGWERAGLNLPASGHLRARGRTTGSDGSGSSGLVETVAAFASEAPEIAVEQPPGTDIPDGGSANFGTVNLGDSASLTFTIRNTGTANLVPLTITKDGADAALFAITASPLPLLPGGSTSFTVRFTPTATGARSAMLHIETNDPDENPFDLTLTGAGALSTNADLSDLVLSSGAISPGFDPATTSYVTSVASHVASVTLTPTAAQSTAVIRVNGVAVASGNASGPISVNVGNTTLPIVVTAGDGVTTKTYNVTVTRPAPGTGPGDVDGAFTTNTGFFGGNTGLVNAAAVQPDGKILLGGIFNSVAGTARENIARLNANGTLDSTFNPGSSSLRCLAVQDDGKVVIGGSFDGTQRPLLARLQPNGALDSAFTPNPDGDVLCLALQADGKVLLGGEFRFVAGDFRSRIARLNADGTLDTAFNPSPASNGQFRGVFTIAVQADGKILLGGDFTSVAATPRARIARLNPDGTLDTAFDPGPPATWKASPCRRTARW